MKFKIILGIIGIALICPTAIACNCQPKEAIPDSRYTEAQVIARAKDYLRNTRDKELLEDYDDIEYVISKTSYIPPALPPPNIEEFTYNIATGRWEKTVYSGYWKVTISRKWLIRYYHGEKLVFTVSPDTEELLFNDETGLFV